MMTDKHRKNILRAAKRREGWYTMTEGQQDLIIYEECKKRGFELCHFYATDGKMLNKLLGI